MGARTTAKKKSSIRGCSECGGPLTIERPTAFRYAIGGLPEVVLAGGIAIERCSSCGAEGISIPRIEQLHETLAFALATQKRRLTPAEARFLRKYLGHSTSDLAALMGVAPETVSRWESEKTSQAIGPPTERLLRLMVLRERPVDEYPTERLAEIGNLSSAERRQPLRLEKTEAGWRTAA